MNYPFWDGNWKEKRKNCFRYAGKVRELPKTVLLYKTGAGITKRLSRYSGQKRETQKSFPSICEREFKAFQFQNMQEREFPLMSWGVGLEDGGSLIIIILILKKCISQWRGGTVGQQTKIKGFPLKNTFYWKKKYIYIFQF